MQIKKQSGLFNNRSIVCILGIKITNASMDEAIKMMEQLIVQESSCTHSIFIVNAHTLNLATENPEYWNLLNSATLVFGDGTGVCWAAKLRGTTMKSNLVGTDLIPNFFQATSNRGYRYFLLGATATTISYAVQATSEKFPGWEMVGFHHGYFGEDETANVIEKINFTQPHVLLVAMGNPKQENWIHANQSKLQVPLCIGVGGLFDHWAGNLNRAPIWVRQLGFEWLQILLQQPHKWQRYIIGNPKYLFRILHVGN
jgi:N-acetylglucosaminyldiphosphoundecaprenol N-acetyl-beta-D-mannosaminyltransferase